MSEEISDDKRNTSGGDRGNDKGGDKGGKKKYDKPFFRFKKRVDFFNTNPDVKIDYKTVDVLVKFVSNKGKILPRRLTGLTPLHQRKVAVAIKRARNAGLLPFSVK